MAVLGTLPLLAARAAVRGASDPPPIAAAATVVFPLLVVVFLLGGWVRFRDAIHPGSSGRVSRCLPPR